MDKANLRGFLLIDGSKNTLLIPKEDICSSKNIDKVISENIRKAKKHETLAELHKDISLYLKCEYEDGNGLHD